MTFRLGARDALPLVATAAIPLVFLHARYQAHVALRGVDIYGSDVAIVAVLVAAFVAGLKFGWYPLRRGTVLWIVSGLFIGLMFASCFWRPLGDVTTHLTTVAKYAEYALLAPAVALLFRRQVDLDRFLWVFVLWAAAAGLWGALMFVGIVDDPDGPRPGQREVSFLGHQALGSFAGAAVAIGFTAIALGTRHRLAAIAVVGGGIGVVIDASVFAYLGTVLAAIAIVLTTRWLRTLNLPRLAAIGAILVVIGSGVYVLRGSDVTNYLGFLGITEPAKSTAGHVETGEQRALLLWMGWEMWKRHPVLGLGIDRSNTGFQPYLPALRRRFPGQPAEAYPSKENPWGVQNYWLELAADMGIPGFILGVSVFVIGLVLGVKGIRRNPYSALVAVSFVLIAAGTWNALGIIPGIALDALTWIGLGLCTTAIPLAMTKPRSRPSMISGSLSDGSLVSPVAGPGPVSASVLERLAGWALPVVFVLLFVAVAFMPGITSGTSTVNLADLALLGVTIWALVRVHREGLGALRGSLWMWIAILALLAYLVAASLYPAISDPDYAWKTHLGTAVKFAEYAVLVPVSAVLLRDARSVGRLWAIVAGASVAAAVVAALQFVGVKIFEAWPPGLRQPSFTGISVLGTLGASAIAVGFAGVLWPGTVSRRVTVAALVGGVVSTVLSGEAAAGIAIALATIASILLVRQRRRISGRQFALVLGVAAITAVGLLVIRNGDIKQFQTTIAQKAKTTDVNTFSQRALMLYIGLRIWEAHPVFGAGWQSVREQHVYSPFLPAAHRRFPNQPDLAFPSPVHRWGVNNAYVQSLAELGIVGTMVFLGFLATGLALGIRGSLRAPPGQAQLALVGLLWLLVTMGIWTGQGLLAGTGFTALPFFGLGLIAAQRAAGRQERAA